MSSMEVAKTPSRTPDELTTEAFVGRYKILVVEGPSDRDCIQQWANEIRTDLVAVQVDEIDLAGLYQGGEWGNRDRVSAVASELDPDGAVRCLIDRDLDGAGAHVSQPLMLTDFPGLETYVLCHKIFASLIRLISPTSGSFPDPSSAREATEEAMRRAVEILAGWLVPLYRLRQVHRAKGSDRPFPTDLGKFRNGSSGAADWKKICVALGIDLAELDTAVNGKDYAVVEDLRPIAYGHDIAAVIFAAWPDVRQRSGQTTPAKLERLLLTQLTNDDLGGQPLFVELASWSA